jgi:lysyl-tRNA synthetase class 2
VNTSTPPTTDRLVRDRLAKLEALRRAGVEPYAYRFPVTHRAVEAKTAFRDEGPAIRVALAGRLVGLRRMGRSTFAHLADQSGRIQLYFQIDRLGVDTYERLELLDLGDWIGVEGELFRTKTGEITVRVDRYEVLAKSLRPLPIGKEEVDPVTGERRVHYEFSDREARLRLRYVDLAVHPEVREVFLRRTAIVRALREFLDSHGFVEVETPILQPLYGGARARPFVTHLHTLDLPLYLRIADELYLKRLIVGGFERVYEIGKDFRNEGMDRSHNPEFTMLEFYAAYWDYEDVLAFTERLLPFVVERVTGSLRVPFGEHWLDFTPPYARLSHEEALRRWVGVDPRQASLEDLRQRLAEVDPDAPPPATRPEVLDALFKAAVEPHLVQPTVILDHPRALTPLAKPKRGDPWLAERFELFVAGMELINAYSELNDPIDQRARFEEQARARAAGDEEAHAIDEDFLRALEFGMPPTGGFGMGVDRLTMILANQASIRDVILFPTVRPERHG